MTVNSASHSVPTFGTKCGIAWRVSALFANTCFCLDLITAPSVTIRWYKIWLVHSSFSLLDIFISQDDPFYGCTWQCCTLVSIKWPANHTWIRTALLVLIALLFGFQKHWPTCVPVLVCVILYRMNGIGRSAGDNGQINRLTQQPQFLCFFLLHWSTQWAPKDKHPIDV